MKVKVNRVRGGSMGDQRNYGLVTGSIWNYENKPDTNRVSDVLSPVPRDEANIEAERNETIVGDLDNDGTVEHAIVGGKRHFQGGTPLNVPDGSFVFSDYNRLKIRNKDLLKGVFNYTSSNGATPAQVAKRYELNKYKEILNDPESDALDRKTAQLMLDNNMRKLGQLALVQEGMKGFPDGIPDIALPLLGTDLAQTMPSQQPPMMKKGGLVKHQSKGPVKTTDGLSDDPRILDYWVQKAPNLKRRTKNEIGKIYYDKKNPERYENWEPTALDKFSRAVGAPFATFMSIPAGENWYEYVGEHSQNPIDLGLNTLVAGYSFFPNLYRNAPALLNTANQLKLADNLRKGSFLYDSVVESPLLKGFQTGSTTGPKNQANQPLPEKDYSILDFARDYPGLTFPATYLAGSYIMEGAVEAAKYLSPQFTEWFENISKLGIKERMKAWASGTGKLVKKALTNRLGKAVALSLIGTLGGKIFGDDEEQDVISDEETAQTLSEIQAKRDREQNARAAQQVALPVVSDSSSAVVRPNSSAASTNVSNTSNVITLDPTTNQVLTKSKPTTAPTDSSRYYYNPTAVDTSFKPKKLGGAALEKMQDAGAFTQYPKESYIESNDDIAVIAPSKNYGQFKVQSYDPKKGYYTVLNPTTGQTEALDPNDFITRQEPILSGYDGGVDAWKKAAFGADAAERQKATEWFQNAYNKYRTDLGLPAYFFGKPGDGPYGVDKQFGIYTWSAPGVRKKAKAVDAQPAEEKPAEEKETTEMQGIKPPSYTGAGYYSPWTDYSLVDYYTALGNAAGVNRGMLPPFATYTPREFEPTFLDPARAIAQQQGLTAQTQQEIGAISDPQVARANMIAASAKAAPEIANIMAQYDNQNVGIANQAAMTNIAAVNDARLKNIGLTDRFMERLSTREQQYENAMRDARTKVADSYKRGAVDARQWAAMNQTNPNYYYDQFGNIRFKPGYNPTKDPSGSSGTLQGVVSSVKEAFPGISNEEAAKLAMIILRGKTNVGATNPADVIWDND